MHKLVGYHFYIYIDVRLYIQKMEVYALILEALDI